MHTISADAMTCIRVLFAFVLVSVVVQLIVGERGRRHFDVPINRKRSEFDGARVPNFRTYTSEVPLLYKFRAANFSIFNGKDLSEFNTECLNSLTRDCAIDERGAGLVRLAPPPRIIAISHLVSD